MSLSAKLNAYVATGVFLILLSSIEDIDVEVVVQPDSGLPTNKLRIRFSDAVALKDDSVLPPRTGRPLKRPYILTIEQEEEELF